MAISVAEVKALSVGDVFYECEMGMNIEARVTEAPKISGDFEGRNQWSWKAENTQSGDVISYLLTDGLSHYGPYIYREPQYARVVSGEMVFPLVGAPSPSPAVVSVTAEAGNV